MAISSEDTAILLKLLEELTPDHVSSISASLNEPGSQIGTSKASTKYAFFQKLVELGAAKEVPLPSDFEPEVREKVTSFVIEEGSIPDVADLLQSASFAD